MQQCCVPMQVVVGKKMDDIFMVMEFMEHDLKGLMEAQDASGPVFAMSEVSHCFPVLKSCTMIHNNASV